MVSRTHFELILLNGTDFQLKCLSKNGLFVNNNYLKMSSISVLPKQYDDSSNFFLFHLNFFSPRCTLRFPSTDMCITFSSLINNINPNSNLVSRTSPDSLSRHVSTDTSQQQQQQQRLPSSSFPMETTNPSTSSSLLLQSVPNVPPQQQQVILVAVNQHPQRTVHQANNNQELNNGLPPLNLHMSNATPSTNRSNGQMKNQYENATTINALIG